VRVARQRAVAAANQELLRGYWENGAEILRRQQQKGWGAKVIERLAADLRIDSVRRRLALLRRAVALWRLMCRWFVNVP
jgi:hypothetical protein